MNLVVSKTIRRQLSRLHVRAMCCCWTRTSRRCSTERSRQVQPATRPGGVSALPGVDEDGARPGDTRDDAPLCTVLGWPLMEATPDEATLVMVLYYSSRRRARVGLTVKWTHRRGSAAFSSTCTPTGATSRVSVPYLFPLTEFQSMCHHNSEFMTGDM